MGPWSTRVVVGVVLGFLLVVAGFGATALAQQAAADCYDEWAGTDAVPDCEDALHETMTWGGALLGTFGVALLAAAGYEHWTTGGEGST